MPPRLSLTATGWSGTIYAISLREPPGGDPDMGLLTRMSSIVKARMSGILDRAEDPQDALDYSYEKQLELLQNVKRGIVEVVTGRTWPGRRSSESTSFSSRSRDWTVRLPVSKSNRTS
jgi:hypothetical protein